jgi:molybdopterin-guanine dinucleotide biosynthesis protein A
MGTDKARLALEGVSLAVRAAKKLTSAGITNVRIIGQADPFPDAEFEFIQDIPRPAISKPASIIGLRTAVLSSSSEWTAVLACDLVFVTSDLIRLLVSHISEEHDAVFPQQPDGRLQPLCALYRSTAVANAIESLIAAGELRSAAIADEVRTRIVTFDAYSSLPGSANFFHNVNTPEDYKRSLEIALQNDAS